MVQSDVLHVLIQGALHDELRDVLQFVLLKDFYFSCHLYAAILFTSRKQVVKIFYATESGTAKRFADNLRQFFNVSFNVTMMSMST